MAFKKWVGFVVFLASTSMALAAPVNINTADASTLAQNIIGVGHRKAEAIVAYRLNNGPFKTVQDLTNVRGIGQKLIDRNRDVLLLVEASDKDN